MLTKDLSIGCFKEYYIIVVHNNNYGTCRVCRIRGQRLHDRIFSTVLCDAYNETNGNSHECDLQSGKKERVKRGRERRR